MLFSALYIDFTGSGNKTSNGFQVLIRDDIENDLCL